MNRQLAGKLFILALLWGGTVTAGYHYFKDGAKNAGLAALTGGLGLPTVIITYKMITGEI